jgi:hypothetical protein|tara:strand:- start:35 stop:265 length:231 start_codon:yes stop_codon:yes gene_type:complete
MRHTSGAGAGVGEVVGKKRGDGERGRHKRRMNDCVGTTATLADADAKADIVKEAVALRRPEACVLGAAFAEALLRQ